MGITPGNRASGRIIADPREDVRVGVGVVQFQLKYTKLLGPFYGAIVVPSVTRCRCCGHR